MVKALLFDFWGTLAENGVQSPIKQVKYILRIPEPFSEFVVRFEHAMMIQSFPTLNLPPYQSQIETLIGMWNKSWMLAFPYPEVEELLTTLHKEYTLILISNTDEFSINNVLNKFNLRRHFDHIFLSCDLGVIKTDNGFLKTVLDRAHLAVEDCLLIGDSIQSDIVAAQRVGVNAILLDRSNTRDFTPKIKNLHELQSFLAHQQ